MGRIRLRLEGLIHCWYVVPPSAACIQDVCTDIVDAFELQVSCPDGVSLHMEGFVLPPGQSVLLLNDKDLISVQQRDPSARDFILPGNSRPELDHSSSKAEPQSKKRKDIHDDAEQRLSALTDDVVAKKARTIVDEPESSDSAITPSSKPMTKHATSTVCLPRPTKINFPLLFAFLTVMQLPCTDLQLLRDEYAGYKKGKISRETMVEKLKEVAGVCTLRKAMKYIKEMAMSRLQPLSCSMEHAAGQEAENSTIMPK